MRGAIQVNERLVREEYERQVRDWDREEREEHERWGWDWEEPTVQ